MIKLLAFFYDFQRPLFKGILFISTCSIILYLLPIQKQWAFNFEKGKIWGYSSLYAPFDFGILKSDEAIEFEKKQLREAAITYFDIDPRVEEQVKLSYKSLFSTYVQTQNTRQYQLSYAYGLILLDSIYSTGILPINYSHQGGENVALIREHSERDLAYSQLLQLNQLNAFLNLKISPEYSNFKNTYYQLFFEIIQPNLIYNSAYSERALEEVYNAISPTHDLVLEGELIVAQNALIDSYTWDKLHSLQVQFSTDNLNQTNYNWVLSGYALLVSMVVLILLLFIRKYRPVIFEHNTKMTFIFFNLLLMVAASTFVLQFFPLYIYALPVCIFPLITKTFFDARLGLFVHLLSVMLIGFVVPNGFEYMVIQLMAGIVTILSVSELYKRANLFISVFQITFVYLLSYFSFYIIREGGIQNIDSLIFLLFIINGLLTLFVQPLIYFYEKLFNLVSDVSLLELSDTNSPVFKELSNKAPGTFHHSLQVANLAEAAADAINANVLLTRVGALYHDIGKIKQPTYFTENQRGTVSPHDDLIPIESARIIINHVIDGIELAKKYKLPDRVIDFIRTHHGTSTVYFFYKKQLDQDPETNANDFRYRGPKPFSKETAIVMMVDAVEAASRSIKEPSVELVEKFVTKIIGTQMEEKQFVDSNITFAEIETIKKVLIDKLINIYHLRIEYPE